MMSRKDRLSRIRGSVNILYRTLRLYWSNGSIRAWGRLFLYPIRIILGRGAPVFTTIGLTYRCECGCEHCYVGDSDRATRAELTTSEVKSVIDQLRRLGVLEVIFSGGDPLLRKDLAELVRYAHDAGLLTRVNTHGRGLDRETVSRLKEAGLSQCAVSIDDADPDVHDRSRGLPGLYGKALEGVRNLRAFGIPCQIVTLASKRTVTAALERVIALGKQLGVLSVYLCFPVAAGRWEDAEDQLLTEGEAARVRALQDATFVHLELPAPRTPCSVCSRRVLYVSPQGEVRPCPLAPYVMGNTRRHSLRDVWRRHSALLDFMCRGTCSLNHASYREALKKHTESVAASLG